MKKEIRAKFTFTFCFFKKVKKNLVMNSIFVFCFLGFANLIFAQQPISIFSKPPELLLLLKPETKVNLFFQELEKKFPRAQHQIVSENFNIYKLIWVDSSKFFLNKNEIENYQLNVAQDNKKIKTLLANDARIAGVSNNEAVTTRNTIPNDSFYNQQYYLPKIALPQLWDVTQGGNTLCGDTVVVAVMDKGFDVKISDFAGNVYQNNLEIPSNGVDDDKNGYVDDFQGYNFYAGSDNHLKNQVDGDKFHGTECAGIIGARGNNAKGIAGVNWRTKMLFLSGLITEDSIIRAYDYAYKMRKLYNETKGAQGAFIAATSLSLGIEKGRAADHLPWCSVYDKLGQVGILNIVAATNSAGDLYTIGDIPGLCKSDYLIVVHSTDANDKLANISPTSMEYIGIAAPGVDILTTYPNGSSLAYDTDSGNSFAAPQVAGVATLLYSSSDKLCPKNYNAPSDAALRVKKAIYSGADKISSLANANISGGRLNAFKAYQSLQTLLPTVETQKNLVFRTQPNPADALLTVQFENQTGDFNSKNNTSLQIFNAVGQMYYSASICLLNGASIEINTSTFPNGLYILNFTTEKNTVAQKIIVNH